MTVVTCEDPGRPRFVREQLTFLAWTYELKTTADYGAEHPATADDAERAIRESAELIDAVSAVLADACQS